MASKRHPGKRPRRVPKVAEPAVAEPRVIETTVFRSGNSDAVRLPKRFGLLGRKVRVRLDGDNVIIEPKAKRSWPPGFFESIRVSDDFEAPPRPGPDPRDEARLARLFGDDDA